MPSELHKRHVADLVAAGWERNGWKDAVRRRMRDEPWCVDGFPATGDENWAAHEVADFVEDMRLVPDAYRFVVEGIAEGWGYPVLVLEMAEVERTERPA